MEKGEVAVETPQKSYRTCHTARMVGLVSANPANLNLAQTARSKTPTPLKNALLPEGPGMTCEPRLCPFEITFFLLTTHRRHTVLMSFN